MSKKHPVFQTLVEHIQNKIGITRDRLQDSKYVFALQKRQAEHIKQTATTNKTFKVTRSDASIPPIPLKVG